METSLYDYRHSNQTAVESVRSNPDLVRRIGDWNRHWIVAAEEPRSDSTQARLVRISFEVSLRGKKITIEEPIPVGTLRNGEQRRVLAAQHRGNIAVVETSATDYTILRFRVERLQVEEQQAIKLDETPCSIHVVDESVYLGFVGSVGWVDFAEASPRFRQLLKQKSSPKRAYDSFVLGDTSRLYAISGTGGNYRVDGFRIHGKNPVHTSARVLRGIFHLNKMAAITSGGDGLVLAVHYSTRTDSQVQAIYSFPNKMRNEPHSVVVEHWKGNGTYTSFSTTVTRGTAASEEKTESATRWRDLAVHEKGILLAAGGRGLLCLPVEFDKTSNATVLRKFIGPTHSVYTSSDNSAWILVGSSKAKRCSTNVVRMASSGHFQFVGKLDGDFRAIL